MKYELKKIDSKTDEVKAIYKFKHLYEARNRQVREVSGNRHMGVYFVINAVKQ